MNIIEIFESGNFKAAMGIYEEAIADYNEVIDLDSKFAEAYYKRAKSKFKLGEYKDAINDYNEAIKLNPDFTLAYSNRGDTNFALDRYEEALSDYTKAVDLDPNSSVFLQNKISTRQIIEQKKYKDEQHEQNSRRAADLEAKYKIEIEKLEAENAKIIAQKEMEEIKDMVAYFERERKLYTKSSYLFLTLVIIILLIMFGYPWWHEGSIENLMSLPLKAHLNLYLWALPVIALETLFFLIYRKTDRLVHFYRHKIAVIGSLEHVFENHTKIYSKEQNDFRLKQYAKLYEPPFFMGETYASFGKDGASIKISEKSK
ncbi:MAG: yrrB 2 [Burkholderiales bacterium]|jgi:tetratricopeptide (TPR) repeat protein|nr:yrrB 2 [Burkholderiales bacterium]